MQTPLHPFILALRCLSAALLACALAACSGGDEATDGAVNAGDAATELAQLEALETQVAADREAVAGFEVLHARYEYAIAPHSGQRAPAVVVALHNGTQWPVQRVSLHTRVSVEGEATPWLDQVFDVPLAGTIGAGAGDSVTLTPRGDSDWALRAPPEGTPLRLRVLPVAIETTGGRRLLTEHAFTDLQRERLAALRAGHGAGAAE